MLTLSQDGHAPPRVGAATPCGAGRPHQPGRPAGHGRGGARGRRARWRSRKTRARGCERVATACAANCASALEHIGSAARRAGRGGAAFRGTRRGRSRARGDGARARRDCRRDAASAGPGAPAASLPTASGEGLAARARCVQQPGVCPVCRTRRPRLPDLRPALRRVRLSRHLHLRDHLLRGVSVHGGRQHAEGDPSVRRRGGRRHAWGSSP